MEPANLVMTSAARFCRLRSRTLAWSCRAGCSGTPVEARTLTWTSSLSVVSGGTLLAGRPLREDFAQVAVGRGGQREGRLPGGARRVLRGRCQIAGPGWRVRAVPDGPGH